MAEETDNLQQPPLLVLVVVEKKPPPPSQQQQQETRAVQFVSLWALLNATIFAVAFAVDYTLISPLLHEDQPPAKVMMSSTRAAEDAVEVAFILCTVLQAAAAALALLLAGHRRKTRLALACAALAAAVASHCFMFASVFGALVAGDPGSLLLRICGALANCVFAHLLCFGALLSVSWELHGSAHESPVMIEMLMQNLLVSAGDDDE